MIDGQATTVSISAASTACSAAAFARKKRDCECSEAPIAEKKMKRSTPACSAARTSRSVPSPLTSSIVARSRSWSRMAAARWTTVVTPRRALRNDDASERLPSAICTRTRSGPSRRGSRTSARTGWPEPTTRRRSADPTLPVAPVSRITRHEATPPPHAEKICDVVRVMALPPFQALIDEHRVDIYRFLRASVGPDEADDCFQETFIAALRAYPRLRADSNLRGWLFTIAHRKALDSHRARGRRAVPVADLPERIGEPLVNGGEPELWRH